LRTPGGIASTGLATLSVAIPAAEPTPVLTLEKNVDIFAGAETKPEDFSPNDDATTTMMMAFSQAALTPAQATVEEVSVIAPPVLSMPLLFFLTASLCLAISSVVLMSWRRSIVATPRSRKLNPCHWAVYR
jgi:hypothetical protein